MEYLDEEILKKRRQLEKEKHTTLDTGIYVNGKLMQFQRRTIKDCCSIVLPNAFKRMPEELIQAKYPSIYRPQKIFTSRNVSTNLCFSMYPDNLITTGTNKTVERMAEALARDNPSYRFYDKQELVNLSGTWFSFRSHAIDCSIFNMILITRMKQGVLQSSFNCLFSEVDEWKHVVLQMWETIEENS